MGPISKLRLIYYTFLIRYLTNKYGILCSLDDETYIRRERMLGIKSCE
ncbi:hypothetical protein EW15_0950 [Prochlorococcus sp. MIT 0801]|nr:hypothetical protein EW15_0950 [Prochlorococcus sp. MIT 0801]